MGTGLKIATALMFATIMTGPIISELGNTKKRLTYQTSAKNTKPINWSLDGNPVSDSFFHENPIKVKPDSLARVIKKIKTAGKMRI